MFHGSCCSACPHKEQTRQAARPVEFPCPWLSAGSVRGVMGPPPFPAHLPRARLLPCFLEPGIARRWCCYKQGERTWPLSRAFLAALSLPCNFPSPFRQCCSHRKLCWPGRLTRTPARQKPPGVLQRCHLTQQMSPSVKSQAVCHTRWAARDWHAGVKTGAGPPPARPQLTRNCRWDEAARLYIYPCLPE